MSEISTRILLIIQLFDPGVLIQIDSSTLQDTKEWRTMHDVMTAFIHVLKRPNLSSKCENM